MILVVPILFERLRLPGFVGLVGAGVILGSWGWHLLPSSLPMINLGAEIGLAYLMFIAGLEFDFSVFQHQKIPALIFGGLTISLSLCLGIFWGEIFGWSGHYSVLVGALLATYSPLAYPMISRLGVINNLSVNVTMAATLVTNIAVLLILSLSTVNFSSQVMDSVQIMTILLRIIFYMMVILVGIDWLGKEFFYRVGEKENYQFLFVLLTVFVSGIVAQLMGIEKIVGVFLAGLAVNDVVKAGPVKEKLVFIGSVLFIPIFFVNLGGMLDISALLEHKNLELLGLIFLGAIASKLIVALFMKFLYQYQWSETLTVWSLSVPLGGITLAITLTGYRAGLFSPAIFNNIIILTLITSVFGFLLTQRLAVRLTSIVVNQGVNLDLSEREKHSKLGDFKIVVTVYNPQTQQYLIEMAALLASQSQGKIIPLAIAHAATQMYNERLEKAYQHSQCLLAKAIKQSQVLGATAEPLLRIDDAFAPAISRAAREKQANLIIMGWGKRHGLRARLFGNVIDNVLWSAHCPVVVARLLESPKRIQRILVPIENLLEPSIEVVKFAQMLANVNQAQVTLLNVCINEARRMANSNADQISTRRSHLCQWLSQLNFSNPPEVQIMIHENTALAILQASRLYDLVIFPYIRNRTTSEGLVTYDITTQLARQLTCSIIILGEPPTPSTTVVSTGIPNPQILNNIKYLGDDC